MREGIERVLRERTLVVVAFAIALGWALHSVALGVSTLITTATNKIPSQAVDPYDFASLNWKVGDRYLVFGPLVGGLIELAVVLATVAFFFRWRERASSPRPADEVDVSD